jgi:hypothetical protein
VFILSYSVVTAAGTGQTIDRAVLNAFVARVIFPEEVKRKLRSEAGKNSIISERRNLKECFHDMSSIECFG